MPSENDLLALLADASDELAASLEPSRVLRTLARLVVPALADWSIVSLVGHDGRPADVESWHREPRRRRAVRVFAEHRFGGRTERRGSLSTVASGEPFVLASGADAFARATLRSPQAVAALDELELESAAVVPILDDDEVIGLITMLRGPGRHAMTGAEQEAAVDLARRASVTLANARSYERERSASEQLQLSLLTEPVEPPALELVTRYVPAAEEAQIGGDWYDAFPQPDRGTVLVVGDVAGHDFAAAALMGQLRSILRGIGVTAGSGPAQLLAELDHAIEALGLGVSASVVVVRVEPTDTGLRVRYSNAGHPAPLLVRADGGVEVLDTHDVILGVVPDDSRQEREAGIGVGDTLLLFTDGLVEHRGEDIDTGLDALRTHLGGLRDLPLPHLVDGVLSRMVPARHDDDVAVLAVRSRDLAG